MSGEMQSGGVIRVYSQSPYEQLDPFTANFVNHLKGVWPLWKNNAAISEMLFHFFANSENPFEAALQIMVSCGDFYLGKQNTLAYHIMENFSNWVKRQDVLQIPQSLKVDAISLVSKQKNYALVKLVVETYRMTEDKEALLDFVQQLSQSRKYKEACQLATLLNLHESFEIEDFVVPLVFQDKYVIAEKFLEGSQSHQLKLAVFLDNLIGKKSVMNEVQSIILYLNILEPRLKGLGYKPLSKLLTRIMKTFNLPPTTCPNLSQTRGKGVLKFLLRKRYVEKSMGGESWTEMALEAVGDDEVLQVELIESVALYGDLKEALTWAKKFEIPEDRWPEKVWDLSRRVGEKQEEEDANASSHCSHSFMGQSIEENWDLAETPPTKFHKLPIEESQVRVIDDSTSFCNFLIDLSNGISIVGIDAEWKPPLGWKKCDLALIQIAAYHVVYIIDVINLVSVAPRTFWRRFEHVFFENPNILKLGFGIGSDIVIMKEMFLKIHRMKPGTYAGFLDLGVLWKTLVNDYKFVFPFASRSRASENLSCLIELCLGESLDKSDQFSNWENRPLRKSQFIYAALDAYCLLEAYNVIVKEAEAQNIPISDVIYEIMNNTATKKATAKRKK